MYTKNGFNSVDGRLCQSTKGFTLLEFVVSLAVVAISIGLAVPALQQMVESNQLVSANNTIVSGLNLARSTAITTGEDTTICPSIDGVTCAEDNWDHGWIVFSDADNDGAPDSDEILRVVTIEGEVSNRGFGENIVFQADGTTELGSAATITNCRAKSNGGESCSDVIVNQFGLIESARHESETTPPTDPGAGS